MSKNKKAFFKVGKLYKFNYKVHLLGEESNEPDQAYTVHPYKENTGSFLVVEITRKTDSVVVYFLTPDGKIRWDEMGHTSLKFLFDTGDIQEVE